MQISPIGSRMSFKGLIYGTDINNKKVSVDTSEISAIEKFGRESIVTKKDNSEVQYKAPFPIVIAACEVANKDENTAINIDKFDLIDYWNKGKDENYAN